MAYAHQSSERAYHRARRARLIAAGLCICCAKVAPMEGYRRCEPCQEVARASSRAYIARQRKGWKVCGICTHCGMRETMPFRQWCGACSEAHTDRRARKKASLRQEAA